VIIFGILNVMLLIFLNWEINTHRAIFMKYKVSSQAF
jgi:hypothetical protein